MIKPVLDLFFVCCFVLGGFLAFFFVLGFSSVGFF